MNPQPKITYTAEEVAEKLRCTVDDVLHSRREFTMILPTHTIFNDEACSVSPLNEIAGVHLRYRPMRFNINKEEHLLFVLDGQEKNIKDFFS